MKISDFGPKGVNRSGSAKKSAGAKSGKKAGAKGKVAASQGQSESDKIEVSDHVQTLDMVRDIVAGTPDIRTEEVDRVMNDMKNGKFKINFEKVAEGFIREALLNEIASRGQKAKRQG